MKSEHQLILGLAVVVATSLIAVYAIKLNKRVVLKNQVFPLEIG
jgi:hypothetical protein